LPPLRARPNTVATHSFRHGRASVAHHNTLRHAPVEMRGALAELLLREPLRKPVADIAGGVPSQFGLRVSVGFRLILGFLKFKRSKARSRPSPAGASLSFAPPRNSIRASFSPRRTTPCPTGATRWRRCSARSARIAPTTTCSLSSCRSAAKILPPATPATGRFARQGLPLVDFRLDLITVCGIRRVRGPGRKPGASLYTRKRVSPPVKIY